jgi:hypothetical protein
MPLSRGDFRENWCSENSILPPIPFVFYTPVIRFDESYVTGIQMWKIL